MATSIPTKEELAKRLNAYLNDGVPWDFEATLLEELAPLYKRITDLEGELSYLNYDYIQDGFMS